MELLFLAFFPAFLYTVSNNLREEKLWPMLP